jgi:uncharacterized membrane protein
MTLSAQIALAASALFCSLVAGFLFAFEVVVMPGIRRLPDGEFLRAFQEIDGVIQRGQPLFGLVWLGSAVAVVAALVLGMGQIEGAPRWLLAIAGTVYLIGVQLATIVVNVPLNNELQAMDVASTDEGARRAARERFEPRWNRWNRIRTLVSIGVTASLLVLLVQT